jgi:glycosyltransferase involved in cell wall biosynthesis
LVVQAVDQGLQQYFPDCRSVILNADNASPDGTREAFLNTDTRNPKIYVTTPEGVRGKGNNLLNVFAKVVELDAQAMVTVDGDLQSIEPHWIRQLGKPVFKGFDLVTPIYPRHKFDGTITKNFGYPMISAVFGHRLRQPIGGDYGVSRSLVDFYLDQPVFEAVRHFGIDIWMTVLACLSGLRVCQSFLDAPKVHGAKDPGRHLDRMFQQVVATVFQLMADHVDQWMGVTETSPSIMFGFGMGAKDPPELIPIDLACLHRDFEGVIKARRRELGLVLGKKQLEYLEKFLAGDPFDLKLTKPVWARMVYDFSAAFAVETLSRELLGELLLALYKGVVLSDLLALTERDLWYAERYVENTVDCFEHSRPYLLERWQKVVGNA